MICKKRIEKISHDLYRVSKKVEDITFVSIKFIDITSDPEHEFTYTTSMYANTYTPSPSKWDQDRWRGFRQGRQRRTLLADGAFAVCFARRSFIRKLVKGVPAGTDQRL